MLWKRMRVIGGEFRSRRLQTPPGAATRPTSDRLRETLFNVLGPGVGGARFLDLYAGSGAVGVEALSRGAAFAGFVERGPPALAAIRSNLAGLGLEAQGAGARALVESRSVAAALGRLLDARESFDFVFLDPPYEASGEYAETLGTVGRESARLLRPGAAVIAEHARRVPLPERFGALRRYRVLAQGDAALSFYAAELDAAELG